MASLCQLAPDKISVHYACRIKSLTFSRKWIEVSVRDQLCLDDIDTEIEELIRPIIKLDDFVEADMVEIVIRTSIGDADDNMAE